MFIQLFWCQKVISRGCTCRSNNSVWGFGSSTAWSKKNLSTLYGVGSRGKPNKCVLFGLCTSRENSHPQWGVRRVLLGRKKFEDLAAWNSGCSWENTALGWHQLHMRLGSYSVQELPPSGLIQYCRQTSPPRCLDGGQMGVVWPSVQLGRTALSPVTRHI